MTLLKKEEDGHAKDGRVLTRQQSRMRSQKHLTITPHISGFTENAAGFTSPHQHGIGPVLGLAHDVLELPIHGSECLGLCGKLALDVRRTAANGA